jgi:hypothetical protein
MTTDNIVAFDTTVAFGVSSVALMTSTSCDVARKHIWNFDVLQEVQLSYFFYYVDYCMSPWRAVEWLICMALVYIKICMFLYGK